MLSIKHLSKVYAGKKRAVDNMNIDIEEGAVSYTHLTLPTKA